MILCLYYLFLSNRCFAGLAEKRAAAFPYVFIGSAKPLFYLTAYRLFPGFFYLVFDDRNVFSVSIHSKYPQIRIIAR